MPRMPIQSIALAGRAAGGSTLGEPPSSRQRAVGEPRCEPAGLLAERVRLGHHREAGTYVREQVDEGRGRLAVGVGQRLRGDGRDDANAASRQRPTCSWRPGARRVRRCRSGRSRPGTASAGARLLGPPGLHHVEDLDGDVTLAEDGRVGQEPPVWRSSSGQMSAPGHRQPRPSRARPARCGSCRSRASRPSGYPSPRRHVDRVVAHGRERRGRRSLGLGSGAAQPAEHARQDAERDGGLEMAPLVRAAGQQLAQRAQRSHLVLLLPECLEQRRVLFVGRSDRLCGERADALGQGQPVAGRARRRRPAPRRRASR